MQQSPDSPNPVVISADTDPAHITGLRTSDSDESTEASPEDTAVDTPDKDPAEEAPQATEPAADEDEEAAESEEAAGEERGPVFEVSDRRGLIRVDGTGVLLQLDDTEARLPWRDIGAVEDSRSRWSRRFTITVHTTNRRRFDADVEAPSRRLLDDWARDLDTALDTWFDDGTE